MTKNNLLSEKLSYIGASDTPTHLHLCSYNAEEVQSFQENNLEKIIPSLKEDHINWIQVHGLQNTEWYIRFAGISVSTFLQYRIS